MLWNDAASGMVMETSSLSIVIVVVMIGAIAGAYVTYRMFGLFW